MECLGSFEVKDSVEVTRRRRWPRVLSALSVALSGSTGKSSDRKRCLEATADGRNFDRLEEAKSFLKESLLTAILRKKSS